MSDQQTMHAMVAPLPGDPRRGTLHMASPLTPYDLELITESALGGARLDLLLPADTAEAVLASVVARLPALRRHGLVVRVGRDGDDVEGLVVVPPASHPGRAAD